LFITQTLLEDNMSTRKALNSIVSFLMIASLLMGATTQVSAKEPPKSGVERGTSAKPVGPTDETKVPHYFGPWPNWANSPFTLPNAAITIAGAGTGAEAVAEVDPQTGGIASIQVISPGSDYAAESTTVTIDGGNGDALAVAHVGVVTQVTVAPPGAGYRAPLVAFSGGGAAVQATGTAYGSVNAVTITNGGGGYAFPTVEFELPNDPNGVRATGHAEMTGGVITAIIIDNPGSGYSTAPGVAIYNGTQFDPINLDPGGSYATATTTLQVDEVGVDNFGSGYTSAPTVAITDSNGGSGSGASATAAVSVGGITRITVTNPGSGYLTVGMRKFIDQLPGLCDPAGAGCPTSGKYIPLAVPEAKVYNGIEADEYVIALVQYRTSFSSDLPPTLVRGYVQLESATFDAAHPGVSQNYVLTNADLDPGQPDTEILINGVPAIAVTPPQFLGPVIVANKNKPVRIIFYNLLPKDGDGDLFLPVDSSMMGSGMGPMAMGDMNENSVLDGARSPDCTYDPQATDGMGMDSCFKNNRATLHLHGGISPWISDGTAHQWITPAGETTTWPQGVSVSNVPDMGDANCNGDRDGCMTFYYTNQQSARLLFYHDHSWGITRLNVYAGEAAGYLITDETEQQLFGGTGLYPELGTGIPLIVQDRTFVPDADQLALQDPTWDTARWGTKGSFWYHHVYMPAQNPGDPGGMSAYGRWMYGPWFWPPATGTKFGPIPNPYYDATCDLDNSATWTYPVEPFCEPELIPGTPNISAGMEQFNDTPLVNGVAYPTVTLEPKAYRFRVLNAANDRFFNFQWYVGDPSTATTRPNEFNGQPIGATEVALNPAELAAAQLDPVVFPTPVQSPATEGPDWLQIGTEGGFLPAPVLIDGQQPTTWINDPTVFNVGNVDQHSLLLAPAERADVIVDFSQFAGKTLILYNDAPAAFPARIPSYDYYTGAPDLSPVGAPTILPGYGPNTRTIMQVKIADNPPATAFVSGPLVDAFAHHTDGSGVFESGQHPIIVGQAAYNSAYGTTFAASSNCNAPGNLQRCDGFLRVNDTTTFGFNSLSNPDVKMTMHVEPKAIHDETNSSTFDEYGRMQANLGIEAQPPEPGTQNVTLYPFVNPQTELIDATNLPRADVTYAGGLPVSDVKITPIADAGDGTQIWRVTHNGVDTHPIHFHLYDVQLLNRVSWDNIIAAPEANELGWKDTVRIAPLEDTIVALRPIIPELPWELPNAIRELNPMMPANSTAMFHNVDPQGIPLPPGSQITNKLVNFGWEYVYHCHILSHEEMDMMRPVSVALPPVAVDDLVADAPVDIGGGNWQVPLSFTDSSVAETSFELQRMTNGSGTWVTIQTFATPLTWPNTNTAGAVLTYDDTVPANVPQDYRVVAKNAVGYGGAFPGITTESVSNIEHLQSTSQAPYVVSVVRESTNPISNAATVDFRVTFSEAVDSLDFSDFSGTVVTTDPPGNLAGPFNVTAIQPVPGSGGTSYIVTLTTGSGNGKLRLDIPGTAIFSNQPGNLPFTAGQEYSIEKSNPMVQSINRSSPDPSGAATVWFTVTFSEIVTGVDKTDFTLNLGPGMSNYSIASVTGTGSIRSVAVTTGLGDGTLRLDLIDNGTIVDTIGNELVGAGGPDGSRQGDQSYTINKANPVVSSIQPDVVDPLTAISNSSVVSYNVTFSETVTGVDPSDFYMTGSGVTGAWVMSVNGNGNTRTVMVNTGSGSGTLFLNVRDNNTILNSLLKPLGGPGLQHYITTDGLFFFRIDKIAPTVSAIDRLTPTPTNDPSVSFVVTFSEKVTGVDLADFVLADGSIADASLTEVIQNSPSEYTVVVGTGTAPEGTVGLNLVDTDTVSEIKDIAKNPLAGTGSTPDGSFTGQVYTIDRIAPTVSSILRASSNPTGAATVNYTVTFSEDVMGVEPIDFILTYTGGIRDGSVTSVTGVNGSASSYTVEVHHGTGKGTLRLDLPDSAAITDIAGNALPVGTSLGNLPFTGDEFFTILPVLGPGKYDDANDSWIYSGTWSTYSGTGPANNTMHYTAAQGDSAQLFFNGTQFVLTFAKSANRSSIDVYVDDQYEDTIDANQSTTAWQQTWTSPSYTNGNHSVRLEHAGTGTYIDVDAIRILGYVPAGVYDDANDNWVYSGTWSTYSGTGPANNTMHYTAAQGDSAQLLFKGAQFILTFAKAANRGTINVYVDDLPVETIDANESTTAWQQTWTSPSYTNGNHSVRLEHAGTGAYIDIDAIQILVPVSAGSYDDTHDNWVYSGTWSTYSGTGPASNTMHYTATQGDSAQLLFNGTQFVLTFAKSATRGSIDVYVDDQYEATIDANQSTIAWQQTWPSPTYLSGNHSVRLEHAGGGSYIDIDKIVILP
jgi:FtsP/CotA-like multicopper oxidase with cupredoxin domain